MSFDRLRDLEIVLAEADCGREELEDEPFAMASDLDLLMIEVPDRLDEQLLRAPRERQARPTRRGCVNISFLGCCGVVGLFSFASVFLYQRQKTGTTLEGLKISSGKVIPVTFFTPRVKDWQYFFVYTCLCQI